MDGAGEVEDCASHRSSEEYEKDLESYVQSLPLYKHLQAQIPRTVTCFRGTLKVQPQQARNHLTHHTLARPDAIPVPSMVFADDSRGIVWAFYRLGPAVCGHKGITHGGIGATLLDEVMGRASFPMVQSKITVTAELTIRYRAPVPSDRSILVRAETQKVDGRKVWLKGYLEDPSTETIYVEADALFIEPRQTDGMEPLM